MALIFGLDYNTLISLYGPNDPYNSNMNTRAMWKYAANRGVSGTPTPFINGVRLANQPDTVQGWLDLLQSVYDSQY